MVSWKHSIYKKKKHSFVIIYLIRIEVVDTIDFVDKGNLVYRTNATSRHKNIVQIGAADSVTALKAATVV